MTQNYGFWCNFASFLLNSFNFRWQESLFDDDGHQSWEKRENGFCLSLATLLSGEPPGCAQIVESLQCRKNADKGREEGEGRMHWWRDRMKMKEGTICGANDSSIDRHLMSVPF
jgi:hypothetical protein